MGLNLRKIVGQVGADLNPFDGPKPKQVISPQAQAQIQNAKYGPLANNPTLQNQLIKSGIRKPPTFADNINNFADSFQTAAKDTVLKPFITHPIAEIAATLHNKPVVAKNSLEAELFGPGPIQPIQQKVVGQYRRDVTAKTNSKAKVDFQPVRHFLAAPLAAAEGILSVANDAPVVSGVYKGAVKAAEGAVPAAKVVAKGARAVSDALEPPVRPPEAAIETAKPTPKAAVSLKQAGAEAAKAAPVESTTPPVAAPVEAPAPAPVAPTTPVARQLPQAHTSDPLINKTINDMAAHYSKQVGRTGNVENIIRETIGQERLGNRLATRMGIALKKGLTPEENQAVHDFLDGHLTEAMTPKALEVANALGSLDEAGLDIRKAIAPETGRVHNYSPRIADNSLKGSATRGVQKAKTLATRFSLESPYSKSRVLDKFVGSRQTHIGNPTELGLKDQGGGIFKDKNGKVYHQQHATQQELEDAGFGPYARRSSTSRRIYHSDTARLKARAEAVNELKTNPNQHGLFTKEQVESGAAPKDVRPVVGITGLEDADKSPFYAQNLDAKSLVQKLGFERKSTPVPLRAFDAISNVATQFIVLNPIFHGMNQLFQTGIAAGNMPGFGTGWFSVAKHIFDTTEDDMRATIEAGAGGSDYGAGMENLISKATGGATKLNAKAMAAIEIRLRTALYKASVEKGMSQNEAVSNINKFLGEEKYQNETARRLTLFLHYFKTMAGAVKEQATHPIEQKGSIANTALLTAIVAATTYGYQKLTGNPNAYTRAPGEIGLVKEAIQSANEIRHGDLPSLITNRINPVAKEAVQQATNHDFFTDQPIGNSVSSKVSHARDALIAPAQVIERGVSGKRSIVETTANQLGLNTPHARGYQAAPNLPALNTKGAITAKTGDPTGEQQQQGYFNNVDALKKQFAGNKNRTDAINTFLDRDHDPATGATIQNSPADSKDNAAKLATDDTLRGAIQKFEKSQSSHAPVWDLSPDKLATLMTYRAQLEGSAEKSTILASVQNGTDNWITDVQKASNDFYNSLPKIPGSKAPIANGPVYPTFDPQTTTLMATYNAADPTQKAALQQQYSGELSDAFNKIAVWTNDMRVAQTGKDTPQMRAYPQADADTQKILTYYNSLPKGDGPNGTSPSRSAWITANPAAYSKMQDYLTQTSLNSLISQAAKAQFAGTTPSQQLLKDIKNIGQYDIAKDSTGAFSINPALAYAQSNASFASYKSNKENKYLGNASKFTVKPTSGKFHVSTPKVTFKKANAKKSKVTLAKNKKNPNLNKKVTLKV